MIPRRISFVAAKISCDRPFIGPLIRASGAIPVQRPQDLARAGTGIIIRVNGGVVTGRGCSFRNDVKKGEILAVRGVGDLRITGIISDNQVQVEGGQEFEGQQLYRIIPKLDFTEMYSNVWETLKEGRCVGIFPEGGSHDRQQLLPLKAGVCIMALGAADKFSLPVQLVPCGFNYFNADKFRSKVVVQFGQPYTISPELLSLYRSNSREAISRMLGDLQLVHRFYIDVESSNYINQVLRLSLNYVIGTRPLSSAQSKPSFSTRSS